MAVIAAHPATYERTGARAFVDLLREVARHVPILLVLGLVLGIHVPTLEYHFFGDDYLVLGDVNTRSFPAYMRDVVMLRDLTPNWRPLTMAVYYGEFHLFGMDALPWRITNLAVHMATVLVLYALVLSITQRVFVAAAAALVFGLSASAVHTVTYITAFPHVLSEFLLITSLFALHRYVQGGERRAALYWTALALYIAGFLANEGGVVLGGVMFVYYACFSLARRRDVLDFALKMAPFALAAALLVGGLSGCECQGVEGGFYGVGQHMPLSTWVYMSRLAYPVDQIPLEPSAMEWAWGSVVAGFALFFLVRGPHIARFAAVGLVLALMPYVPSKMWTATRYTYMATPFFAILVAVAAGFVYHHGRRVNRYAANALAAAALAAVGGLYAWQTFEQTDPFVKDTARWRLLSDELRAAYPDVPAGTTIYIADDEGLWSNPYWQPTWMTSVGRALYGDDVSVRAYSSADLARLTDTIDSPSNAYFARFEDGHLAPVGMESVQQGGAGH